MDTFGPLNAALIVIVTIVLTWYLKDRFGAIDKRFDARDKRSDTQDARIDGLDARVDVLAQELARTNALLAAQQGRLEELSREFVGMRSDLLQIALAVGAKARPEPA